MKNTEHLELSLPEGNDYVNIEALNENWRKIDAAFPGLISLIEERARVVSGTVTGNSNAGEDEPNSITFPFVPKMVIVTRSNQDLRKSSHIGYEYFIWQEGLVKQGVVDTSYGTVSRCFRRDGNTLYWWTDKADYPTALVGNYIAFG